MTSKSSSRTADTKATVADRSFPLPLVPFEAFNLADDRPEYPKTFVIQLTFSGCMDRRALDRALRAALASNPLLRARVEQTRRGGPVWVLADREPRLDWRVAGEPLPADYTAPVDLREQTGLGLWVRVGDAATTLFARFHHACCDGLGAFGFLEDLLAAYHAVVVSDRAGLQCRATDMTRLARRGEFEIPHRTVRQRLSDTWLGARGALTFYRQRVATLAPPPGRDGADPAAAGHAGFVTVHQTEDLVRALRWKAGRAAATLNDLLLRELFLVLRDWNRDHGNWQMDLPLRILMPTSLRSRADQVLSAANRMSFAFLTRTTARCAQADALLADIRDETERIRRDRLSLYFLGTLGTLAAMPPALRYFLRRPHCFASAVLTNLGDPTRRFVTRLPRANGRLVAGNLQLETIAGVPPLRPLTHVAFSIVTYGNRLCISGQCDPHSFFLDDARSIVNCYAERLTQVAGLQSHCSTDPARAT